MEKELVEGLPQLLKDGGLVGFVVFIAVLTVGLVLRYKGFFMPMEKKDGGDKGQPYEITVVMSQIGKMDARLKDLERDVEHLPTRAEIHALELSLTRLDGRFSTMEETTKATGRAVSRIEDFMIDVSKRNNK